MARNAGKPFQFVSVAVDTQGPEAVRPWTETTAATFPTVVDRGNALAAIYNYKVVPNGVFLDEDGIIRYIKIGGFNIENAADVAAIQQLIDGEATQIAVESKDAPYHLNATERALIDTRMRLGAELFARGARDEAIAQWQQALSQDPENLTIRKQIWMAAYPEKFHPTIDFAWQKIQLAQEREDEMARGICGPDGCPIPQVS